MTENEIASVVFHCAQEVHRHLGPGLFESAYEKCLAYELTQYGLKVERQVEVPLNYKGVYIDCGFRADIIVEDKVIIELKAVVEMLPLFSQQVLTYLKITDLKLGLLINFNTEYIGKDAKRIVNNL